MAHLILAEEVKPGTVGMRGGKVKLRREVIAAVVAAAEGERQPTRRRGGDEEEVEERCRADSTSEEAEEVDWTPFLLRSGGQQQPQ